MSTENPGYAEKVSVTEIYGSNCFNDVIMRERLPKSIYKEIKKVQAGDATLTLEVAEVVANAMKDWALENGATHYTHWFQPLTGLTAEKHDSFINPTADGRVIMEFSGKELTQGEPDASSFPNGGLRATFEARGYTAWDITSPAFLREDKTGKTLYIPTAFVSYTSEALDKKVPLLRSMEAVSKQGVRLLRAIGNETANKIISFVGPEQEYFLVEKELYQQRPDLVLAGRTVFGKLPAKGQELSDHYFGTIKERVATFMRELNHELWKLGISAKTQHNEVAPNQFELATIFDSSNVATDRNQLIMDSMKKIADRHDLFCLLHEKPFAGVNGSGKHNNWSLNTDDGVNLMAPGDTPHENAQFLLFLVATIKAIDKYAPLMRLSAASAGNDHRLGGHEAPPAIISIYLGDELTDILEKLSNGKPVTSREGERMEIGVTSLPKLPMDTTDRNRTSPFAFTGNKFEFRMVGSNQSIAGCNAILNTIAAEILQEFAEELEGAADITTAINDLIIKTYKEHKRVVFNGDGYSEDWVIEAEKRGLPNLTHTVAAYEHLTSKDSVEVFGKHGVHTAEELESRQNIYLDNYSMHVNIEAGIMAEMSNRQIYPAALDYAGQAATSIAAIKEVCGDCATSESEDALRKITSAMNSLKAETSKLEELLTEGQAIETELEKAHFYREKIFAQMEVVRTYGDELEMLLPKENWPFPSYEELLFCL